MERSLTATTTATADANSLDSEEKPEHTNESDCTGLTARSTDDTMATPLEELGYPLAFEVDAQHADELDAPAPRLGQAQRTRVRAVAGMQKEALVTDSVSGATWRLVSDEGEYLDGDDVAPAPLAFMTTGMVSSFANELLALADDRGVDVDDVTLVQDNYYTMNGSALRGTMTGGALPVELEVRVDADADDATLRDLAETATETSPVNGLLTNVRDSAFKLSVNGDEVPLADDQELDAELLDDPRDIFDGLGRDAAEQDPPVVHRTGRETEPLPDAEQKYTSGSGSSLQEEQDRVLHVRGVCSVGEDGVKTVEVKLFSPIGTVFELRSDEPAGHGGAGRAPSAMAYVAAGLGFCFMTQIGRYADIVGKDLDAYRVVQDTHFSTGARERGETPGEADPVETHVFFETGEDDEAARDILSMSEQTCFLHALCRTDLDAPDVDVTRL